MQNCGEKMFRLLVFLFCVMQSHSYLSGSSSYRYHPDTVIRVTSVLLEPYLMKNPDYMYDNGQKRFIGFIPDLMTEIANLLGRNYVIMTSPDNSFGYKQGDGSWDGMIGELLRKEADIAAGPMYVTSQRSKVVDFTIPFMDVEATLLLRKPPAGTTLQIRSIGDLLNQSEIKYGTLARGVLIRAFKSTNRTLLKMMWRNMERFEPTAFTDSNEDGIHRVRTEKYAFVIPHTIGEYMSMQEPCDLVTVDRFLMNRGYSLAVGKGYGILQQVNLALRTLKENGKLHDLYRTWWVGRSQCNGSKAGKIYGRPYIANSASTNAYSGHQLVATLIVYLLVQVSCMYSSLLS